MSTLSLQLHGCNECCTKAGRHVEQVNLNFEAPPDTPERVLVSHTCGAGNQSGCHAPPITSTIITAH
jgi:hypothetical protein